MIRQINNAEWPEALGVIRAALSSDYDRFMVPAIVDICRDTTLVVECSGRILGVVTYYPVPSRRIVEIPLVCVKPYCRGHGLGRALVQSVVDKFPPADVATFRVDVEDYGDAFEFFQAIGWRFGGLTDWDMFRFALRQQEKPKARGFLWRTIAKFI